MPAVLTKLPYANITEQTFCHTKTFTELIISICLLPLLARRSRACNIRDARGKVVFFFFAVAVVDCKYICLVVDVLFNDNLLHVRCL